MFVLATPFFYSLSILQFFPPRLAVRQSLRAISPLPSFSPLDNCFALLSRRCPKRLFAFLCWNMFLRIFYGENHANTDAKIIPCFKNTFFRRPNSFFLLVFMRWSFFSWVMAGNHRSLRDLFAPPSPPPLLYTCSEKCAKSKTSFIYFQESVCCAKTINWT